MLKQIFVALNKVCIPICPDLGLCVRVVCDFRLHE